MVLAVGKVYVPGSASEITKRYLEDIELEARNQGIENVPIQPGTDLHFRGTALANALLLVYGSVALRDASRRATDAEGEELDDIRIEYGLPEVPASRASGKVEIQVLGGGTITLTAGKQAVSQNGTRYQVPTTQVGLATEALVTLVAIDGGENGNLAAGEKVTWVQPPLNLVGTATVDDTEPLEGGLDAETDTRKRDRILNRLRNNPGGGNWAQVIEWVLNSTPAIQYAFVYQAIGGPSSFKVVVIKAADPEEGDFSRTPTASALLTAHAAVAAEQSDHVEFIIQGPVEVSADAAVYLEIPDAPSEGGDGTGWTNSPVWPPANVAGYTTVNQVTSTTSIRINATTASGPAVGDKILWWSPTAREFVEAAVATVSGSSGLWSVTLDTALTDSQAESVAVGDFISPSCTHYATYAESFRTMMVGFGPGENTADANRLPRSLRRPRPTESSSTGELFPQNLGNLQLNSLTDGRSEITDATFSYRLFTAPTAPALVSGAPEIFIPRHFGVYPMP